MKKLSIIILLCLIFNQNVVFGAKPSLKFNSNGDFKIVQFTDTHITDKIETSQPVFELIRIVIEAEKPDMVVFTGDIVLQDNAKEKWDSIDNILSKQQLPWIVVFGNHEEDYDTKRPQLTQLLMRYPRCLNSRTKNVEGESNFILPILDNNRKAAALIYGFDTHSYSKVKGIKGYGWVQLSQLNWYRNQSANYTRKNNNTSLPAIAFIHIPLPEYSEMANAKNAKLIGIKNEKVASGALNSGLFAQLVAGGDVMGVFCGHDHNNDYIGEFQGVALGYGRFGLSTPCWYKNMTAGARVIVLKQGKRSFVSWINTFGKLEFKCTFPDSFTTDN